MLQYITIFTLLTFLCVSTAAAMPPYAPSDVQDLERTLDAHLSVSDRLEAGPKLPDIISEHARLTLEAVNAAPWREALTPDLVRAYILPLRVTEEPLEAWRASLRNSLAPLLPPSNAAPLSPLQAAQAIRTWMSSRAVPGASHPWDLGPLELLSTGSGRCEELGILFICAARALGLPARICYTPAWRDTDGNHLWVEVWDGKNWQAFSIEQPTAPAGTGWFLPQVDASALVLAKGFGPAPASETDEILRSDRTGFLVNRTAAYTTTGSLRLPAAANAAPIAPVASIPVASIPDTSAPEAQGTSASPLFQIYVYNGQRPRPILSSRKPGQNITLGTGTYLVSIATEEGVTYKLATVRHGQTTLPMGAPNQPVQPDQPTQGTHTSSVALKALSPRNYHLASLGAASVTLPPHVPQTLGFTPPRSQHPPTAPGPQPLPLPASAKADGAPHLSTGGTERIDNEPASQWREVILQAIRPCIVPGKNAATAKNINSWAAQWPLLPKESRAELGTIPLSIKSMVEAKVCGSAYERVLLTVAALRSAGIPAKVAHLGIGFRGLPSAEDPWGPWVEFYDGSQWLPLYPADPTQFGKKNGSLAAKEYYGLNAPLPAPDQAQQVKNPAWRFSPQMRISIRKEWGEQWALCRMAPNGSIIPVFLSTQEAPLLKSSPGEKNEQGEKFLEVPPSERYIIVW